jgi:ABC-2 type transport system permease protein
VIAAFVGFELRRRLKVASTYVYALVLFASGFFMMLASGGVFRSVAVATSNERVMVNSPHSLFSTIGVIALFGLFTVAAVFGQAAYQDFGNDTFTLIFTKNVKKGPYLVGRFLGAFVFSAVLFLAIAFGQLCGSLVVFFVHPESLGKTSALAYLWPYVTQVWPMLFFTGAVFFSLAAITRRMAPVYVGVVVLVLGYLLATTLVQDVTNKKLAGLIDPFGFFAFGIVTRYWTPAEQNRDLVPLLSLLGANRAIWSAVGVAALAVAMRRFRTTIDEHRGRAVVEDEPNAASVADEHAAPFPTLLPSASTRGWIGAWLGLARMYFGEIARSAVFWALVLSGVIFGTLIVLASKAILGTATLPVTYQALELTLGGFKLFTIIIVTFYAGELVWRERDVNVQDIVDATRAPTWVAYLAKLSALLLVALAIEGAIAVVALLSQITRGYFAIEWKLYVTELLVIDLSGTALSCVLAMTVQIVVNHKYVGHAMMVVYYIATTALRALGVEEPLVRYASSSQTQYSDMNGYGHLLWKFFWLRLYWWGFALLLVVLGYAIFVRGRETKLRVRLAAGRRRLGAVSIATALVGGCAFVGAGAFVFYNTRVLNTYETAKDDERHRAAYEKKYKTWQDTPQPSIVGADTSFDIFPAQRRLVAKGTYRLANKRTEPIARVMLNVPNENDAVVHDLRIADDAATETDRPLGVRLVDLKQPMQPGEERDLVFDIELRSRGFTHGPPSTAVVENGTFVHNYALPVVGYNTRLELENDGDRKDYQLPAKERMAPRDDAKEAQHNYIRQDSDFISFATTVSTSSDQIAMAPGYLEKEWASGDRRFFRYVMDQPILNFFSVLSARYAVKRDEWNGVKLEILYHPAHTTNLDRMMDGMKDSLAYCTEAFGPYQHRQARILEFPRYQTFAQSFPNTIPYSEGVGFIARVRDDDPDDVDYPYYVTAHEIAHQWWAHQVVGANVRGATMTSESMAQYSALMVMKKKYGAERMRRFLKFELDGYLRGRVMERKKELPLAHNENQPYIHYQKGSVAMYALADAIGEDRVNRALRSVVEKWKLRGPPYPTAKELVDAFRAETPPEYLYLLDDLFETITLYDNRVVTGTMRPAADGTWNVSLKVIAKKVRSDDKGNQTELDFEDYIDVGALDDHDAALHVEKRKIKKGESTIDFTTKAKPVKVGIDPLNKLIDRDSEDNVTTVTLAP